MTYYAKSKPKETIMEHTNILLENLKVLKIYTAKILNEIKILLMKGFGIY